MPSNVSNNNTNDDSDIAKPFDDTINLIIHRCERNQVKMYKELQPRVEAMYKDLNLKLMDMYTPVLEACRNMRDNRNRAIAHAIESSLTHQLQKIIQDLENITFDPDDVLDYMVVHVWTPEFETINPYCDTTLGSYERLKISISVTFPTVAQENSTGKLIALTATEYESLILQFTPLCEQECTITRSRDKIAFVFDYEYDDLTIEPDSTYCEYPNFPTRPAPTTY